MNFYYVKRHYQLTINNCSDSDVQTCVRIVKQKDRKKSGQSVETIRVLVMKLVMTLALAMAGMIGMIAILAIYCLCVKMRPNQTPKSKLKTSNKGSNKPGSIRKLLDKKNSNRLVLYSDTSSSSSDDSDNDSVWIPKRLKPLRTLVSTLTIPPTIRHLLRRFLQ